MKFSLQQPIAFPQEPLDAVPDDCIAKLLPCGKACFRASLHREYIKHHVLVRIGTPMMIDGLKLFPVTKDSFLRQPIHPLYLENKLGKLICP